jgi:hypothetical protein
MGLDSTLYVAKWIPYDNKKELGDEMYQSFDTILEPEVILFEGMYWRKCWSVHNFFTKECGYSTSCNGELIKVDYSTVHKLLNNLESILDEDDQVFNWYDQTKERLEYLIKEDKHAQFFYLGSF